jgi:SAM-dependent methyltransferase
VSETRDRLRLTFDSSADLYEAARPAYPEELFDDLVALAELRPGDRLLEIGCATGKATRRCSSASSPSRASSLARSWRSTRGAPWPAFRLSSTSRRRDVEGRARVVRPRLRGDRLALGRSGNPLRQGPRLLRPGGHLAFWRAQHAFPAGFDPFFAEIQEVYETIGESRGEEAPPPPEDVPDERAEIEASGLFEDVQIRRYLWERSYTAEEYVALLDTFSGHIAMEAWKRERLYGEIRRRLAERPDGRVLRHWHAILHVARRK